MYIEGKGKMTLKIDETDRVKNKEQCIEVLRTIQLGGCVNELQYSAIWFLVGYSGLIEEELMKRLP